MSPATDPNVIELSRNEILDRLERGAQAQRGISAAALARAYRNGQLEEACEVADLVALVLLLPDDDPLFDEPAES